MSTIIFTILNLCSYLMIHTYLPKRFLFLNTVAVSAILDVISGSNFQSWSRWHSDLEQNYLGVLGIIWTAGWDFPIIGSCDTVLLLVGRMISDDGGKLESGEATQFYLFKRH